MSETDLHNQNDDGTWIGGEDDKEDYDDSADVSGLLLGGHLEASSGRRVNQHRHDSHSHSAQSHPHPHPGRWPDA